MIMKIRWRSYNEETLDLQAPEFLPLVTKISSDQINSVNDPIYISRGQTQWEVFIVTSKFTKYSNIVFVDGVYNSLLGILTL